MIKLNGKPVVLENFPDQTMLLREGVPINFHAHRDAKIEWFYSNDWEFTALSYLVQHLRSHGVEEIHLFMPYIPNARQDRVEDEEDVFTLKYFTKMLNSLHLTSVTVLDPHSNVSIALIDNVIVQNPLGYVDFAVEQIRTEENDEPPILFYPDEGASKRYSHLIQSPYLFGVKIRDWKSGDIKSLQVIGETSTLKDKSVLIVDDISSYGGTFLYSTKALKEFGIKNIYLYITHCENSILSGKLINSGLLKRIYTTNSIFTEHHELIEVIPLDYPYK